MKHRTRAYWPTRILLAVGFTVTAIELALPLMAPAGFSLSPVGSAVLLAGVALALVGLAWMLRIFRGPSDEPPAWRYRERP